MENQFFEKPVLNSPYDFPARHWELDSAGQPTQRIVESRRRAEFITPIPKPRKQKVAQDSLLFDQGLSTQTQETDARRWAFAEFTDVFQMQTDFGKKVEAEFDKMIDRFAPPRI